jgi:hypothetical protein
MMMAICTMDTLIVKAQERNIGGYGHLPWAVMDYCRQRRRSALFPVAVITAAQRIAGLDHIGAAADAGL